MRFEPMTCAIPVQYSINWANKPTESWSCCDLVTYRSVWWWRMQVNNYMKVNHIIMYFIYKLKTLCTPKIQKSRYQQIDIFILNGWILWTAIFWQRACITCKYIHMYVYNVSHICCWFSQIQMCTCNGKPGISSVAVSCTGNK